MTATIQRMTSLRQLIKADALPLFAGAVLCVLAGSLFLLGWPNGLLPSLSYPYSYSGDGLSSLWLTQRAMEGWIFENERSGFPFGASFLDYPGADSGSFLILKIAGMLTGSNAAALNIFFLLGFAANFATAYLVTRWLRVGRTLSFVTAVLFTLAPFHFLRISHIFYTWYFSIPIYFMLAIGVARSDQSLNFLGASTKRKIALAVGYLVLACFGVYYTAFGLILIGTGCLVALFRRDFKAITRLAAPAIFFLAVGTLANIAPNVIHQHLKGPNPEVAVRAAGESEVYGIKPIQLVLPRQDHRSAALARITSDYMANTPLVNENHTSSLGLFGSIGLLLIALVTFARLVERRTDERLALLSILSLMLLAFMVIGGLGSVFAHLISPSIRGWNRASIFISFSTLAALAITLQMLSDRMGVRKGLTVAGVAGALMLMIGAWDQTSPACTDCQAAGKAAYEQDKQFIGQLEAALPTGAAIYQLPYMGFPEVPAKNGLHVYDLAVGYIHSKQLKWSYAGMKGRQGDLFYRNLETQPVQAQLAALRRFGFDAVYIDKRGYADGGAAIVDEWRKVLGAPPAFTRDDAAVVVFKLPGGAKPADAQTALDSLIPEPALDSDVTLPALRTLLVDGWSADEAWGVWSSGPVSSLRYRVNAASAGKTTLLLRGNPFLAGPRPLRVHVRVNGATALKTEIMAGQHLPATLSVPIETHSVGELVNITIEYDNPVSPAQLGLSEDQRQLAFGLTSVRLCKPNCSQ